MKTFSLTYKDQNGDEHTMAIEATSGTHALSIALDEVAELKAYPGRITRVFEETK